MLLRVFLRYGDWLNCFPRWQKRADAPGQGL
jgi:hypothetical protein